MNNSLAAVPACKNRSKWLTNRFWQNGLIKTRENQRANNFPILFILCFKKKQLLSSTLALYTRLSQKGNNPVIMS